MRGHIRPTSRSFHVKKDGLMQELQSRRNCRKTKRGPMNCQGENIQTNKQGPHESGVNPRFMMIKITLENGAHGAPLNEPVKPVINPLVPRCSKSQLPWDVRFSNNGTATSPWNPSVSPCCHCECQSYPVELEGRSSSPVPVTWRTVRTPFQLTVLLYRP